MATAPTEAEEAADASSSTSWRRSIRQMGSSAMSTIAAIPGRTSERMSMEGLLKQAKKTLLAFMNPELSAEQQIPERLLKNARGIVILTVLKAGFGIGGMGGSGILLVRNTDTGDWSLPSAIGCGGLSYGFQIGASKVDYVIILNDDASLEPFLHSGQLKVGGDINASVGPKGRNIDLSVAADRKMDMAPIMSYSMSKGAYVGLTVNGSLFTVRKQCNKDYYQRDLKVSQIVAITPALLRSSELDSAEEAPPFELPVNNDYQDICILLKQYVSDSNGNENENDDENSDNVVVVNRSGGMTEEKID